MPKTPPASRDQFPVFRTMPTRWKDMDAYGHLNNATYFSFLDTAISLWQMDEGMDIAGPGGIKFVVVANGCTYHAEAKFPDILHAGIRISKLGGSSVRYEIGLFRNDEDVACVEGYFVHVCVDDDTRPMPIPDRERAVFEGLMV